MTTVQYVLLELQTNKWTTAICKTFRGAHGLGLIYAKRMSGAAERH